MLQDGRVVFMLPWLGHTIAGTTDSNSKLSMLPKPSDDEVQFILHAISDYLTVQVDTLYLSFLPISLHRYFEFGIVKDLPKNYLRRFDHLMS